MAARHRAHRPGRPGAPAPGARHGRRTAGFTLVESLVIVAVMAALASLLLPSIAILRRNSKFVASQNNMRNIGSLMSAYSTDSRDYVLPSQFDYSGSQSPGIVRTSSPSGLRPPTGALRQGSWADILWTASRFGPLMPTRNKESQSPDWDYRYDSPDYWAYTVEGTVAINILRSHVDLLKAMPYDTATLARPFGKGASIAEQSHPGYFAANDFFNGARGRWYTNAQIRMPANSLYLVDSRAGETIPLPSEAASATDLSGAAAANPNAWLPASRDCEVEFRYIGDLCSMLYLDGHIASMAKWTDLNDLQVNRQTRVEGLDRRPTNP
jgi:type II secretory pathway pseudopilin PulG